MSGLTNMVSKATRMLGNRSGGTTGAHGRPGTRGTRATRHGGGAGQRRQDEKIGRAVRSVMRKVTR